MTNDNLESSLSNDPEEVFQVQAVLDIGGRGEEKSRRIADGLQLLIFIHDELKESDSRGEIKMNRTGSAIAMFGWLNKVARQFEIPVIFSHRNDTVFTKSTGDQESPEAAVKKLIDKVEDYYLEEIVKDKRCRRQTIDSAMAIITSLYKGDYHEGNLEKGWRVGKAVDYSSDLGKKGLEGEVSILLNQATEGLRKEPRFRRVARNRVEGIEPSYSFVALGYNKKDLASFLEAAFERMRKVADKALPERTVLPKFDGVLTRSASRTGAAGKGEEVEDIFSEKRQNQLASKYSLTLVQIAKTIVGGINKADIKEDGGRYSKTLQTIGDTETVMGQRIKRATLSAFFGDITKDLKAMPRVVRDMSFGGKDLIDSFSVSCETEQGLKGYMKLLSDRVKVLELRLEQHERLK